MKMKINLKLKFGTHNNLRVYIKIPFQLILKSAVNSCLQRVTANEHENEPRELKFGTNITLRVSMKIPFFFP